jgi:hypothetical protein
MEINRDKEGARQDASMSKRGAGIHALNANYMNISCFFLYIGVTPRASERITVFYGGRPFRFFASLLLAAKSPPKSARPTENF